MTSREVVVERQLFIQEAFLESLQWGYGTLNTQIGLEDFLSLTFGLKEPYLFTSQRHLQIPNIIAPSRPRWGDTITCVTGKVNMVKEGGLRIYHPEIYYAIITKGHQMAPQYTIDIYTTKTKKEMDEIENRIKGRQTKMSISTRDKIAIEEGTKWEDTFPPTPRAS